jgi:uncharacterized protein with HEPN domain
MRNDVTYLRHILDAAEKIEGYLAGVNYESFLLNSMMIDAVVRELEIIGESAKNLSDEFCERYHEVPWSRIRGMRNVLIHEYFDIDLKVVWDTCKMNLPPLKAVIQKALGN